MVHFVGAGSGAPDLITLRGKRFLEEADVVIYAGSLVNPQLLEYTKENCEIYNSAKMTLEEVLDVIFAAEEKGLTTVRLHTGDPSLYGAIREQMDVLEEKNIAFDYCPGVSSFCGAASALNLEYTLPDVSQSVIITRMEGRTPVPEKESIQSFAAHQATMVVFLSTGMLKELSEELMAGGFSQHRNAGRTEQKTDRGWLHRRYAGSDCIQSDLGRSENIRLYSRNAGTDSKRKQYYKDRTDDHR